MYTEVTFAEFLGRPLDKAKAERGIEFHQSPNVPIHWTEGDWLYEIQNGFSVRLFRWLKHDHEVVIDGPDWGNLRQTREEFEARFENEFDAAIERLSN